jgi:hypothetical protein
VTRRRIIAWAADTRATRLQPSHHPSAFRKPHGSPAAAPLMERLAIRQQEFPPNEKSQVRVGPQLA